MLERNKKKPIFFQNIVKMYPQQFLRKKLGFSKQPKSHQMFWVL